MTQSELKPVPMILYCPQCGQRHVDEPDERTGWANPPHRSHLCHDCGCIWRPADVPTNGVAKISTQGAADTWSAERGNADSATPPNPSEPLVERVARAIWDTPQDQPDGLRPYTWKMNMSWDEARRCAENALAALPAPADDVEIVLSQERANNPHEPFSDEAGIWNEGFCAAWETARAALSGGE